MDNQSFAERFIAQASKHGVLVDKCLSSLPEDKKGQYISDHSFTLTHPDSEFSYSILFGPSSQVIHRFKGKPYYESHGSWMRRLKKPSEMVGLIQEMRERLESEAIQTQKQALLDLESELPMLQVSAF